MTRATFITAKLAIVLVTGCAMTMGCSGKKSDSSSGDGQSSLEESDPASAPAPAPSSEPADDPTFEKGGSPQPITGINLTYDNARARCDFTSLGGDAYQVVCTAVAADGLGHEFPADTVAEGLKIDWRPPTAVSGQVSDVDCVVGDRKLDQTCSVKVPTGSARLAFSLDLAEAKSQKSRVESAYVFLPYSVGVVAGFVPSVPYLYAERNATGSAVGFQVQPFGSTLLPVRSRSLCAMNGKLYFEEDGLIFFVENGKTTHYAGSSDERRTGELTDRRRISFAKPLHIACSAPEDAVYVSDGLHHRILKVTAKGPVLLVAEAPDVNQPGALALAPSGELLFADDGRHQLRKIGKDGKAATIAEGASLGAITDIAVAKNGEIFVVSSLATTESRVARLGSDGQVTAVLTAGVDTPCNGVPPAQCFIKTIAAADDGRLLVVSSPTYDLAAWDGKAPPQVVLTRGQLSDGHVTQFPQVMAAGTGGDVYLASNSFLWKIPKSGPPQVLAGADSFEVLRSETRANAAIIEYPSVVTASGTGDLYFLDFYDDLIRRVTPAGQVATVWTGDDLGDDDVFLDAFAVAPSGDLYVSAERNILKKSGQQPFTPFVTVPATFPLLEEDDVSGIDAADYLDELASPVFIGNDLYFLDSTYGSVMKVDPAGQLTTIAGRLASTPADADWGDGGPAAETARLHGPFAIAPGPNGDLYVADTWHHAIRRIDSQGIISTIAGQYDGVPGFAGDGGDGRAARLHAPKGLAVANDGTIYFADTLNRRIRFLTPKPGAGATTWTIDTFFGGDAPGGDCGAGRIENKAVAADLAAALKSSLAVICAGQPLAVAVKDTCPQAGGSTTILFSQTFGAFNPTGNLVQVVRPCVP